MATNKNITKKGFNHDGETIYFMEPKGKDISFNRWRITLYYAPHLAKTHFEYSEQAYNHFLKSHSDFVYDRYMDYRAVA